MDISTMADELINYYLIIAHKDISDSLQEKSEEEIKRFITIHLAKMRNSDKQKMLHFHATFFNFFKTNFLYNIDINLI